MSFRIQVTDPVKDRISILEVDSTLTVIDLKALIEVEFQIPVARQILNYGGKILQDNDQLSKYQMQNEDLILIERKPKQQRTPLEQEAIKFIKHFQQNPHQLEGLRQKDPKLAECIDKKKLQGVMDFIQQQQLKKIQEQQEYARKMQQLEQDPFNPENQRLIEEMINKKNIEENRIYAEEYVPESFGTVTMLYIELSINRHPVQAFVDSGAQSTIMSKACAERCGIMRLVDTRFQGIAQGVGTQKIIGRIHVVEMQILDQFLPCSLTILDGDGIDFLFGLDMLKRYQCNINLKDNCLVFPNEKLQVSFLPEGQINKRISIQQEEEILKRQNSSQIEIEVEQPIKQEQSQQQPIQQQPIQQQPIKQQPTQQQQPKQQKQQSTIPQSKYPESTIQAVMNVGASRQEAITALDQTNGNEELAASIIVQQKYGFN